MSSANFIRFPGYLAEQPDVSTVNSRGLRTHPCGEPVLRTMVEDETPYICTDCGLNVKKFTTQLYINGFTPGNSSLLTSVCGMMVLITDLKFRKSSLFWDPRWTRADTASETNSFSCLQIAKGPQWSQSVWATISRSDFSWQYNSTILYYSNTLKKKSILFQVARTFKLKTFIL